MSINFRYVFLHKNIEQILSEMPIGLIITVLSKLLCKNITSHPVSPCRMRTLNIGSIVQGVIEIYGTTNHLVMIYAAAGVVLCISGFAAWMITTPDKETIHDQVY